MSAGWVRPALRLGVALAVAGMAAMAWPRPTPVFPLEIAGMGLARSGAPAGPVSVNAIRVDPLWTASRDAVVTISLSNRTAHPVQAKVWWLLGRPGDRSPWTDPVARSAAAQVAVPAAGRAELRLPALPWRPRSGQYTLSAWVHTRQPGGTFQHSDGVPLAASVTVATPDPTLRTQGTWAALTVLRLRPGGAAGTVLVTLANRSSGALTARLSLTVAAGGTTTLLPAVEGVVDAASTRVLAVSLPRGWPAGRYAVAAVAQALRATGIPVGWERAELAGPLELAGRP